MAEPQKEKRNLRYYFTAPETHELSLQLANKTKDLSQLEEDKKAVTANYGAKISGVRAEINKLSNQVSDGWELQEVECHIHYHQPSRGHKTIERLDTGAKTVEKMDPYDWNLFTQEPDEEEQEPEKQKKAPKKKSKKKKAKVGTLLLGNGEENEDDPSEDEETTEETNTDSDELIEDIEPIDEL